VNKILMLTPQDFESEYLDRICEFMLRTTGETPIRLIAGLTHSETLMEKARKNSPGENLEGDIVILVTDESLQEVFFTKADPMPNDLRHAVRIKDTAQNQNR
jgi:hypothetical protein